jgi:predicted Zn-dependent peptidase
MIRFEAVYPFGSEQDPMGKEGLTHLLEHLLVKSNMPDYSLLDLCRSMNCTIKAATSSQHLRLVVEGDNSSFMALYPELVSLLSNAAACIQLTDEDLEHEKQVVLNELQYKIDQTHSLNLNQAGTSENISYALQSVHPVLGNRNTLARISVRDIHVQLIRFLNTRAEIEIQYQQPTDRVALEKLTSKLTVPNRSRIYRKTLLQTEPSVLNVRTWGVHSWVVVDGAEHAWHEAAVTIRSGAAIRKHIRHISRSLAGYLRTYCRTEFAVHCEIGLITLYFRGSMNQIEQELLRLLRLDPSEAASFFIESVQREQRKHSLHQVCEYILHDGGGALPTGQEIQSSWDAVEILKQQILSGLAVAATFAPDTQLLEQAYEEKAVTPLYKINDWKNTGSRDLPNLMNHEYVELWPGPGYFSSGKYVSHLLWSMIAGLDGALFEYCASQGLTLYSHQFFSREMYDQGHVILYVHCPDQKVKMEMSQLFRNMLLELEAKIDKPMLEKAVSKVLLSREQANRSSAHRMMDLSNQVMGYSGVIPANDYAEEIGNVQPEMVQVLIQNILDSPSIILGMECLRC